MLIHISKRKPFLKSVGFCSSSYRYIDLPIAISKTTSTQISCSEIEFREHEFKKCSHIDYFEPCNFSKANFLPHLHSRLFSTIIIVMTYLLPDAEKNLIFFRKILVTISLSLFSYITLLTSDRRRRADTAPQPRRRRKHTIFQIPINTLI